MNLVSKQAVQQSAGEGLDLTQRLLYRDALILVIDKPAGLPVHSGPKGGNCLEDYFGQLRFGLPHPPALGHRLDRDTSGCLVLGRHRRALARLGHFFSTGMVKKTYWALVQGAPEKPHGTVDLALAKRSEKRGWWMKPDPDGQKAVTRYQTRGKSGDLTWLELQPLTGRTHQIRVHCASLGCPVIGDSVYGTDTRHPLALHARSIALPLYTNKPLVEAEAAPPPHMRDELASCGFVA